MDEQAVAQRSVKSAERVLDILEHLAPLHSGARFVQIGSALAIPKSSLHALLEVLADRHYVELDPETRRYKLGVRVWEAGQAYPRHHTIMDAARAVLRSTVAAVNETAQLARLAGRDNVYMAKEESSHPLRLQSETGSRLAAHATGVGKALLAQLPDAAVAARLGGPDLPRFTPTTHATLAALLEELAETRRRGFAIDNEETTPGVFCLAVPIFEHTGQGTMALSVSVPVIRVAHDRLATILAAIAAGSLAISQRIGCPVADPKLADLADPGAAAAAIDALLASGRYRLSIPG